MGNAAPIIGGIAAGAGSIIAGRSAAKGYSAAVDVNQQALDLARQQFNLAKGLYEKAQPGLYDIIGQSINVIKGYYQNLPEYSVAKAAIESGYRRGMEDIMQGMARRGLTSSGLENYYQRLANLERARLLGGLPLQMKQQAMRGLIGLGQMGLTGGAQGAEIAGTAARGLGSAYAGLGNIYRDVARGFGGFGGQLLYDYARKRGWL